MCTTNESGPVGRSLHSAIPQDQHLRLTLEGVRNEIRVSDQNTLIDASTLGERDQALPPDRTALPGVSKVRLRSGTEARAFLETRQLRPMFQLTIVQVLANKGISKQ